MIYFTDNLRLDELAAESAFNLHISDRYGLTEDEYATLKESFFRLLSARKKIVSSRKKIQQLVDSQ